MVKKFVFTLKAVLISYNLVFSNGDTTAINKISTLRSCLSIKYEVNDSSYIIGQTGINLYANNNDWMKWFYQFISKEIHFKIYDKKIKKYYSEFNLSKDTISGQALVQLWKFTDFNKAANVLSRLNSIDLRKIKYKPPVNFYWKQEQIFIYFILTHESIMRDELFKNLDRCLWSGCTN